MNKIAFIHEFIELIWNRKKVEWVYQYIHDEYTVHLDAGDPWEGKTLSHQEFIIRIQEGSLKAFPDLNFEITSAIEGTDHVAISWIISGTNLGVIQGFPPTGKRINCPGITIYHFCDGFICGHSQVFNRQEVARQLGF
jgi:steroid delta-isomerase-like uncharacterized protein